MGRSPCCDGEAGLKKGPWTPEEDKLLVDYIQEKGHCSWRRFPKLAGLNRCGKSCRLRWTNYLRPDIKRGRFTDDEEKLVIHLHSILGNKWSSISAKLPGRTDNEIKNYWNTHLRKKLLGMGIDPVTHRRRTELSLLAGLPSLLAASGNLNGAGAGASSWDMNALRVQADAAKFQLLQGLVGALTATAAPVPTAAAGMDNLMTLHDGSNGGQHGAGACGVDQSTLLQQCQWDGMNNLPALTSSAPASGMPISGVFDGFGAVDGLSSTELGGHGGASGSNVMDVVAPRPVVAADQECKCNYNGMHISAVLDGFGAGDRLSSTELGGHGGAGGSNVTDVVAPRPMVAADQECKCNYNGMHISGVFDGFGAGDRLSSTELGGHGGTSGSNVTDAVAPHPIVAADQECNYNAAAASACGGVSCKEIPMSSPFDGLESPNLMGDLNTDGDWSDLLDSAPASSMHISGMFDGFGAGGRASGNNVTDAVAPHPIVAVDQDCNNAATAAGVSYEKTPASSPYDGLESLNLMGDLHTDGDWKDLLEQMSWLNSNEL